MIIRKANKEDSLNLAALSIQVWLHTYAATGIRTEISRYIFDTFTQKYFEKSIENPDSQILVATKDNHLIGYIRAHFGSFWKDESNGYEIDKLYVQNHFQGRGLGKRLLNEISTQYGGTFWLSTWKYNHHAIAFYKHLGFIEIGTRYFQFEGEAHENCVLAINPGYGAFL